MKDKQADKLVNAAFSVVLVLMFVSIIGCTAIFGPWGAFVAAGLFLIGWGPMLVLIAAFIYAKNASKYEQVTPDSKS